MSANKIQYSTYVHTYCSLPLTFSPIQVYHFSIDSNGKIKNEINDSEYLLFDTYIYFFNWSVFEPLLLLFKFTNSAFEQIVRNEFSDPETKYSMYTSHLNLFWPLPPSAGSSVYKFLVKILSEINSQILNISRKRCIKFNILTASGTHKT